MSQVFILDSPNMQIKTHSACLCEKFHMRLATTTSNFEMFHELLKRLGVSYLWLLH